MRVFIVRVLSVPVIAVALSGLAVPGAGAVAAGGAVRAGVITTIAGGPGGPAPGTRVAVNDPCGVAFGHGTAYFTESAADLVRRLNPGTGLLSTVAGTGGNKAVLNRPCGTAVDAAGNVVFADTGDQKVRVAAARTSTFYGVSMRAGHVYVVAGGGYTHSTPAKRVAFFPQSVAVDRHGNLIVASQAMNDEPGGQQAAFVDVVGGARGTFYGQHMVPGGIYTIANSCASFPYCSPGFAGDGGPATAALFGTSIPQVAVDPSGDVLVADSDNGRVRLIAASPHAAYGQQVSAGDIYTIAGGGTGGLGDGGPAAQATLGSPQGVAVAADGNVLVSDNGDQRVRLVAARTGRFYGQPMTGGDIYTIAGDGTAGFAGDKGPAVRAELRGPSGVGVDGTGSVLIADSGNDRVASWRPGPAGSTRSR